MSKARQKFSPRVVKAAEQMWEHVRRGISFQIPASDSSDDLTTRAVLCLQQRHPECPVTMLQSRVVVVGRMSGQALVSPEAMQLLKNSGYIPEPAAAVSIEKFLDDQRGFMERVGVVPEEAVARAQAEQAQRDSVSVGAGGSAPSALPRLPADIAPGAEP